MYISVYVSSYMSPDPSYDVVVVGGGPAGAAASIILGPEKIKVLLLEKSMFPRDKPCGGCISQKTVSFLDERFGITTQELKQKNILTGMADSVDIWINTTRIFSCSLADPFYFINRALYDAYLLTLAKETGTEVHEGTAVLAADPISGSVQLSDGRTIHSSVIIGADGVHGTLRSHLPSASQGNDTYRSNLAIGIKGTIPWVRWNSKQAGLRPDCCRPSHAGLFFGVVPYGYGWAFPHREGVQLGIGGLIRKNRGKMRDHFIRFLQLFGSDPSEMANIRGYPLPFGMTHADAGYKRLLITGDAAGYIDPLMGEGIFYAHRTGELAALAAIDGIRSGKLPDKMYQIYLKELLIPDIRWMKIYSDVIYGGLACHLDIIISGVIRLSGPYIIHNVSNGWGSGNNRIF